MSGIILVSSVGYKTSFSVDALSSLLPVQWLLWDGLEWISARILLWLLCMCFARSSVDVRCLCVDAYIVRRIPSTPCWII
jgi:hypothetical protein